MQAAPTINGRELKVVFSIPKRFTRMFSYIYPIEQPTRIALKKGPDGPAEP